MKMASISKKCQPMAPTGIAATLMEKGQTIHSKFKLTTPKHKAETHSKIDASSELARQLLENDVFIIDEVSQVDRFVLRAIDNCLQDLTGIKRPFGNKMIILAGDFRQCLPVVAEESRPFHTAENVHLKADTEMWLRFSRLTLVRNRRADVNADAFKEWVMRIGNGLEERINGTSLIRVPDQLLCELDLIESVYGEGVISIDSIRTSNRAILCPTNEDSLEINECILERVEGELVEPYVSVDSIVTTGDDETVIPLEHAHTQTPNGYPPHVLNLKVGAIVMLIKNWNIPMGLCNGTRLRVVQCNRHFIKCAILAGVRKDQEFCFSRVKFSPSDKDTHRIERFQFPFRLAFAMTINKSQGQTFDKIGILLRTPVFAHGQLYVAVSRVRNFQSLTFAVSTIDRGERRQGEVDGQVGTYTQNIVNQAVLRG